MMYVWSVFQKTFIIFLFTFIFSLVWVNAVLASEPGDLDTSFNGTGIVTTTISSDTDVGNAVAIQSDDNKIVVVGTVGPYSSKDIALTRYNSDGTLDSTFGTSGIITTSISSGDDSGNAVAIQPDGRIVVVGERGTWGDSEIAVLRYTTNGNLDTTFNNTGIVTTPIPNTTTTFGSSVAIQSDGKIVAVGNDGGFGDTHFIVTRYTVTGTLDSSFNNTGIVTTSFSSYTSGSSVAIQDDGKIVVAGSGGSNFVLARYTITGSLDLSFNNTGIVTTPISNFSTSGAAIVIQDDGKIVIAGNSWIDDFNNSDLAVARYTITGALDSTFNNTGIVYTPIGNLDEKMGATVQPDGKIVVTSLKSGFGKSDVTVIRYNEDGSLDTTFGDTGVVVTPIGDGNNFAQGRSVAIQGDGKIVVAGSDNSNFAVLRYLSASPSLHLRKTIDNSMPTPNQLITYTITVSNSGLSNATNVVITDDLDSNLIFNMASDGGVYQMGLVTWNLNVITPNHTITRTLQATVSNVVSGTILNNTAWVTSAQNVTATDSVEAQVITTSFLHLRKTIDNSMPTPNQLITYTITVSNSGLSNATNVVITDDLDSNLIFNMASDGGVYQMGLVTWNLNVITPNHTITRTLQATVSNVVSGTILNNTAWVTSAQNATATDSVEAQIIVTAFEAKNMVVHLPIIIKD